MPEVAFGAGERGEEQCLGGDVGMEGCSLWQWEPSADGKEEWEWQEQTQLKGGKGKVGFRAKKGAQCRRPAQKVRPKERE